MVNEVRGLGMPPEIKFTAPKRLRLRVPFEAFRRFHPAVFAQVLVIRRFDNRRILSRRCGHNVTKLNMAPALRTVIPAPDISSNFGNEAPDMTQRRIRA